MKIAIIGESTSVPSGFGMQTRMLAKGFADAGHNVTIIANNSKRLVEAGEIHANVEEWPIAVFGNTQAVDRMLEKVKPDVAIVFWFTHMVSFMTRLNSLPCNCPVLFWLPWEGSSLPEEAKSLFPSVPRGGIVHLSKYARDLWRDVVHSDVIIPHGVDTEVFHALDITTKELRRKWSRKLQYPLFEDCLILLNVDRNIRHKRWDATLDLVRRLKAKVDEPVVLIAHTHKVAEQMAGGLYGYDITRMAEIYGVKDNICYTEFAWDEGFSQRDLVELYQVADFRISTSEGEGFGIPTVEAALCKVPQIVNKHTTMPELLPEDSEFLVEPAFTEYNRDSLWQVPDVAEMVDRLIDQHEHPEVLHAEMEKAYNHAQQYDSEVVMNKWVDLIELENTKPKKDLWYAHRFGYWGEASTKVGWRTLCFLLKQFDERVVEVGSFTGRFLEIALEVGLDIRGQEADKGAYSLARLRTQSFIELQPFEESWPDAEVLVMTDVLPLIQKEVSKEQMSEVYKCIAKYKWACLRLGKVNRWDVEEIPESDSVKALSSLGMVRRQDLETYTRDKIDKVFNHQIWSSLNTSVIPKAVMEAM